MLSVVTLLLNGEIGVFALDSHGNYTVDHGKSWKNHGIVFLNFCGNLASSHGESSIDFFKIVNHIMSRNMRYQQFNILTSVDSD